MKINRTLKIILKHSLPSDFFSPQDTSTFSKGQIIATVCIHAFKVQILISVSVLCGGVHMPEFVCV